MNKEIAPIQEKNDDCEWPKLEKLTEPISKIIKKYFEHVGSGNITGSKISSIGMMSSIREGYFLFLCDEYGGVQVKLSAQGREYEIFKSDSSEDNSSFYKQGEWTSQFESLLVKFEDDVKSAEIKIAMEDTKRDTELRKFFSALF